VALPSAFTPGRWLVAPVSGTVDSMGTFEDINREVWRPFMQAYAALDVDLFASLHEPGFVRVESSSGWIGDLAGYRARTSQGFDRARERGDSLAIEFRFTERLADGDLASERGVYCVTVTAPDSSAQVFHGRFHSVHRRVDGRWQLLLDHDDVDDSVDAAAFDHAHPLDDTALATNRT
jgi:ketosteroid isomerase-like protein